jgi:hypothetical protein
MTTPAAKWKAAERARHKEAGRVAATVYIWPEDRENLARYVKRLNERRKRSLTANVKDEGPSRPAGEGPSRSAS